jgi:enoyl-CoA hydratase/carnithine racemase
MAMPETTIGLFPDVGGGYFLSRCPGFSGEWLALTGTALGAAEAITLGLADHCIDVSQLVQAWDALVDITPADAASIAGWVDTFRIAASPLDKRARGQIDHYFSMDSVATIVRALEADACDWAQHTAAQLRQRSPLMLCVAFEQIRRARNLTVAQDLRMARDMMRHCFYPAHLNRSGRQTETAEGIRALGVDKDNAPAWQPSRIEDVTPDMVQPFFISPWPAHSHPLRLLA